MSFRNVFIIFRELSLYIVHNVCIVQLLIIYDCYFIFISGIGVVDLCVAIVNVMYDISTLLIFSISSSILFSAHANIIMATIYMDIPMNIKNIKATFSICFNLSVELKMWLFQLISGTLQLLCNPLFWLHCFELTIYKVWDRLNNIESRQCWILKIWDFRWTIYSILRWVCELLNKSSAVDVTTSSIWQLR